jgi:formylglycine-generating enzyme required for sulfatase activity
MPEPFDPYHRWLGIPPKDQPPNHYRLLGLDHFESNPDVIEGAADQRMAYLKRLKTGKQAPLAQRLLKEVAAARICLLNTAKKAIYDQALRQQQLPEAEPAGDNAFLKQLQAAVPPPRPPGRPAARKTKSKSKTPWIALAAIAAGLAVVVLIVILAAPGKKSGDDSLRAERTEADATKQHPPPAEQKPAPPATKQKSSPPPAEQKPGPPVTKPDAAPPAVKQPSPAPPPQQPGPPAEPPKAAPPAAAVTPPPQPVTPPPQPAPPPPAEKAAPPSRLPVPAEDACKKGLAMVHDIYKAEWAKAKTAAEKLALAKKLVEESRKPQNDAMGRYALLQAAHQLALAAGDATIAFQTAEEISRLYDVDALDMKLAAVGKMLKAAKTAGQRTPVVEKGCALLAEAAGKDKFELARQLGQQLLGEARKTHDSELIKSVAAVNKQLKEQAAAFQQFQEAQDTLKSNPADAAANLAVGKYLCFTKGQWRRGLPYLAKAGDKELQEVAGMETPTPPAAGDDQVKLADQWWDLGQSRRSPQRERLLLHAGSWYERAEASMKPGLLKSKIDKRLNEIAGLEVAGPSDSDDAPPVAMGPFDWQTAVRHQRRWSKYLHLPLVKTNSIGMKLILIPPGEFDMGTPEAESKQMIEEARKAGADDLYLQNAPNEVPRHRVKIIKPFYLGVYPVTQGEYEAVMNDNPSWYRGDPSRPIENILSGEAIEFCHRLSDMPKEKAAGATYRLPTEGEWEYACRAGTTTRYYFGDSEENLSQYAWWRANSRGYARPVGQLKPNAWGLYDMCGNVAQICTGGYGYHTGPPIVDLTAKEAAEPTPRGGDWGVEVPGRLRSAYRCHSDLDKRRRHNVGVRMVMTMAP